MSSLPPIRSEGQFAHFEKVRMLTQLPKEKTWRLKLAAVLRRCTNDVHVDLRPVTTVQEAKAQLEEQFRA